MGNQSEDPGRQSEDPGRAGQARTGKKRSARVGQPGEQSRTSQQNAGSTEGGGTRNADNSVERVTDDGGAGREQSTDARIGQGGDDLDGDDIDRPK
jgi:hypothetical protein